MPMKRALIAALTSAIMFNWAAWSQTAISGNPISSSSMNPHGLYYPNTSFSSHPVSIYSSSLSTYLYYWSCGGAAMTEFALAR